MQQSATFLRARQLIEAGALSEAWQVVRSAAAAQPDSAVAMTLAGQMLVRRSDPRGALRHFARAAVVDGAADCRILLNLARAQAMAGRTQSAQATVKFAVGRFPEDVAARGLLALLRAAAGDLDGAASCLPAAMDRALDAATAYRLARHFKEDPRHRPRAVTLFTRAADEPGRHAAAALDEALAGTAPGDAIRFDLARRILVGEPARPDAADAVAEAYGRKGKRVRQAAWAWQSSCLQPADRQRLARAAELTWEARWPAHGIAANLALFRCAPSDLTVIARICQLLVLSKNVERALAWGRVLLVMDPKHASVWNQVAGLYKDIGAFADCEKVWSRILMRFADSHQLRYNHALFLEEQDRLEEAERQLRRSLVLAPGYGRGNNQLSLVCHQLNRIDLALQKAAWTIAADPSSPNGLINRGMYQRILGDYGRAIESFDAAEQRSAPGGHQQASARYNAAMSKLNMGELADGFRLAESRWALTGFPSTKRNFRQPIWPGPVRAPRAGLLLYLEQGLGDELMLSWYIPLLRRDVRHLLVDCDARLIEVFGRTYEDVEFVAKSVEGDPRTRQPGITHKVPSFHVPQHYVPELKALIRENWDWSARRGTRFPSRLAVDPARLDHWRRWLDMRRGGRPAIGLCWRSGHQNRYRNRQYMTAEEIAACIPAGTLAVGLQYSYTDDEIATLDRIARQRGFEFVLPQGIDLKNDLEDVMALLQTVDLAIAATTAVAWMGAAVGCPTYMFWTSEEQMFWPQLGTPFVPWAPSIRIFRHGPWEPWEPTIADLRAAVLGYLERASAHRA